MIATVFTPQGIVVATESSDYFWEHTESDEGTQLIPINMEGLPHTYIFWNKYTIAFNGVNSFSIESDIFDKFDELAARWSDMPHITEFMPYLKKLLMDNHFQIIGIVAAYASENKKRSVPFVYQILGDNIRRINLDSEGNVCYNCVYLEKNPHIGKLLHQVQIKNGDTWELHPAIRIRCDLFSIQKSIDLCRFMLRTSHYVENINSASYDSPLKADLIIITKDKVETKLMEI